MDRGDLEKQKFIERVDGHVAIAVDTEGSSSSSSGGSYTSVLVGNNIGSYAFDASAQTITFSGLGPLNLEDIGIIVNVTDQEVIYNPQGTDKGGSISSNVLTLEYDTTSMSDGDALQISIAYNNSEDYSLRVKKVIDQAPLYAHRTSVQTLVSASDIGASDATYIDQGGEISTDTYNTLGLGVKFTVNDSTTNTIKVLTKLENGATNEYILETSGDYIKTLGDSNIVIFYTFALDNLVKSVQVQSAAGTVGATKGTLDIKYTLGWN